MTPQLLKLLAKNKGKGYFKAESTTDSATIYLYDAIVSDAYWGGVAAIDFIKALAAITAPEIHLRVNSPGGDVFAARAMVQAMKEHPSKIIAHVDGYAASAATFPVIAADESVISNGAMFMIHNAWTIAAGTAKDFADMAALLGRTDQTIVNDYMAKTGQTEQQIKDWMDAETYFYGQEAVDSGFIGAVAEASPKNKIDWDLSAYAKPPSNQHDIEPTEQLLQQNQNRLRVMQSLIHP
jgi:ATP-dependent Clp protease protease subunit